MRLNADACVSSDEKLFDMKPVGEVTPQSGRVWIAKRIAQEDAGWGRGVQRFGRRRLWRTKAET